MNNETALSQVLQDLLDQADTFESIRFTRDVPEHEAEAVWKYALDRARFLLRKIERRAVA